jgi:DNA repair protein RadC
VKEDEMNDVTNVPRKKRRVALVDVPLVSLRVVEDRRIQLPHPRVTCADDAAANAHVLIGDSAVEKLIGMAVNGRGALLAVVTLSSGGMHGTGVRCVDVMRALLMVQASAFVLAHNHPSGDPTPSHEDIVFTERVRQAGQSLELPLLDHVIVTFNGDSRSCP